MTNAPSSAFERAAAPKLLYHCMYREPEGDYLRASCERNVNGKDGTYLFAASHINKALAFAFSYHDGEILCNGGIAGSEDEFALICDRDANLAKPRHIRVFAFPPTGFEMAWEPECRQYVSTRPVAFKDTKLVLETTRLDDLMRHGLQIFATPDAMPSTEQIDTILSGENTGMLARAVKSHGFIWENHMRGINPNPSIQQALQPATSRLAPLR